jgi:hypothetical protein
MNSAADGLANSGEKHLYINSYSKGASLHTDLDLPQTRRLQKVVLTTNATSDEAHLGSSGNELMMRQSHNFRTLHQRQC